MSGRIDGREVDPRRTELDEQWLAYLELHKASPKFDDWLNITMATYRDEIVHYGGQLLNDLVIREWDESRARAKYGVYLDAAKAYDADPSGWETAFWMRVRKSLPPQLRTKFDLGRARADPTGSSSNE